MPQVGISTTKQCLYRDSTQEFSNTYHYKKSAGTISETDALALIDEIVAFEKEIHSLAVTFVRARCWSSGGLPGDNQMIAEKNLTGTGAASSVSSMDRERAFLVQWDAGQDSRGHKVTLKKWYHTCGNFFTVNPSSAGILGNTTGFSSTDRAAIANKADEITSVGPGIEEWHLCAPSGRENDGIPPKAHRYLEHHQLGDQWR